MDTTFQLIAIILYLLVMIGIGVYGFRRINNLDDYMLGGRKLNAVTTALSTGASDMSQWLLLGVPGALYVSGLVEVWMPIGLFIGAWTSWLIIAPRLRAYTEVSNNSITIPSFFDNRFKNNSKVLRIISGIIILVFFTFYVSSGLVAGGVFFQSSFDYSYHTGLIIVAVVTIAYTLIGGFLAVSFTDVVQGTMMFLALLLVPIIGVFATGGFGETASTIREVDSSLFSMFATASVAGVISSLAWGLGWFGMPHVIIRYMAITSVRELKSAKRIHLSWMTLTLFGAGATGLIGVAYFTQNSDITLTDPEAVFIALGQLFFHPFIAGLMLAAVLAAIMSTVSSQLLVTSSALVEDIYKAVFRTDASQKQLVNLSRIAVLSVSFIAMIFAWQQNDTILSLVAFAWAGFGAAFGPVIILSLYWRKFTGQGALWGMVVGAVTVFVWGTSELSEYLYEIVPGFVLCLIVGIIVSYMTYKPNAEVEREFDETIRIVNEENK